MRALTVEPGSQGSARVEDVRDPEPGAGELLVQGLAIGVCGTDKEIVRGEYGWAPAGRDRLVLGHESLGRVLEAPDESGFSAGDLVAGVVRRPDPVPCGACAHGEWDMCRNGRYTERGIKELDGYGSERWAVPSRVRRPRRPDHLGLAGVLTEPTSVVAKAWEQVERVGAARLVRPGDGAGHRRRPDRAARRDDRGAARAGRARARPGHRRPQAGAGRVARRDVPPRARRRGPRRAAPRRGDRGHRRGRPGLRRDRRHRPLRDRLPHRRLPRGPVG